MRTIIIDILNEKAINLLRDLELLKVIRVRKEKGGDREQLEGSMFISKYKGVMTKQPLTEIDKQLYDLRNEWE